MKKQTRPAGRKVAKASQELAFYTDLLGDIKTRIRQAQTRAALAANAELIRLYWDIGRLIHERQGQEGWGAGVIPRLASDLRNELPELKGFSERNLKRMLAFHREYPGIAAIVPQPVAQLPAPEEVPQPVAQMYGEQLGQPPVAQLQRESHTSAGAVHSTIMQQLVAQLPWGHNILLVERIKDHSTRHWYAQQTLAQGWSRNTLSLMIGSRAHERQGQLVSNFADRLPAPQSDLVQQLFKDPYLFDFLTLEQPFHERELETALVRHLEKFLLELGQGFAFVGRQYRLEVGDQEFFIDLLFYHLRLRCFIVIDLKTGDFKPEYAGKMNFYCSTADAQLRHDTDQPTVGLILCQTRERIIAEYALRDIHKPIGVAEYELTRALPRELASSLPSIEQIEAELQRELDAQP